jgi:precorrin-2/cobalt-factor-2 C20-methyltransferase
MSGILYGLGLGPGDPELVTLKAARLLARVPVVAYPAPEEGDSLVRAIAAPHVPPGRIEVVLRTAMLPGEAPAHAAYDRHATALAAHLEAGRDVAVLCEGDPFFYGSFMYLFGRLAPRFPVEVVPGVSSLAAAAAVAGLPLVSRNEALAVVPAPLPEEELADRLADCDAAVVMKVGRHLTKVKRVLGRLGLLDGALYVERATMPDGRVLPLAQVEEAPYFSLVLARRKEP